jgi:hypothetical protein
MSIKVGDLVSVCFISSHGNYRQRQDTVTEVKKTFIELKTGTRFNPRTLRGVENKYIYVDPDNSYWDQLGEKREQLNKINSKFLDLSVSAKQFDWEQVKQDFEQLKAFMES